MRQTCAWKVQSSASLMVNFAVLMANVENGSNMASTCWPTLTADIVSWNSPNVQCFHHLEERLVRVMLAKIYFVPVPIVHDNRFFFIPVYGFLQPLLTSNKKYPQKHEYQCSGMHAWIILPRHFVICLLWCLHGNAFLTPIFDSISLPTFIVDHHLPSYRHHYLLQ